MTSVRLKHALVIDTGSPVALLVSPDHCSANNTDMTQLDKISVSLIDGNGRLATMIANQGYTLTTELCEHTFSMPVTLGDLSQAFIVNTNLVDYNDLAFDQTQQVHDNFGATLYTSTCVMCRS
jgi:hypothetical protein